MQDHEIQDLKRRELEKGLLNHLREAHFAVASLPAVDDDRLPLHPLLWIVSEFGISHSVTDLSTACLPSCLSLDRKRLTWFVDDTLVCFDNVLLDQRMALSSQPRSGSVSHFSNFLFHL